MASGTASRAADAAASGLSASESRAIASSDVVYVFVAATARSGPAASSRTWSEAFASGLAQPQVRPSVAKTAVTSASSASMPSLERSLGGAVSKIAQLTSSSPSRER